MDEDSEGAVRPLGERGDGPGEGVCRWEPEEPGEKRALEEAESRGGGGRPLGQGAGERRAPGKQAGGRETVGHGAGTPCFIPEFYWVLFIRLSGGAFEFRCVHRPIERQAKPVPAGGRGKHARQYGTEGRVKSVEFLPLNAPQFLTNFRPVFACVICLHAAVIRPFQLPMPHTGSSLCNFLQGRCHQPARPGGPGNRGNSAPERRTEEDEKRR